ncbi:ead/Ea22-like family protein [Escherichia coli]|uniref:ead/Ea22-like family protein n=1 Tax=Enterobacter hormaechei TaxID=158836 RepID=UPI0012533AB6|nr:ead/Ea22-like family protein [Enterobacter hormaechei]MCU3562683.1 ead/Ea22-like family protein [Enterobacter hormaechei subsp. hoffmannii]MWT08125.1 ead/Ea22-like family protein [Escherichia coli]EKW7171471.1 ead/Ea22-like family protein [Enterobacter hormaechei]EKW7268031.1 ead/Ea22-like family protein [Enterobacter hormaechei]EMA8099073.1 ead/Ea22-like family protein [Enterobacter hormaechei]
MSKIDKQALRSTSDRDWFEDWFKREFHPDKTGPYIKDQLFFAVRAARAPLLDELEASEKKAVEMPTFDGYVPHVARELQVAFRTACDNAGINVAAAVKGE